MAEKGIKKLQCRLADIRSQIEELERFIEKFELTDEESEFKLNCRNERLSDIYKEYLVTHSEIIVLIGEEDEKLNDARTNLTSFEENYYNLKFKFKKHIDISRLGKSTADVKLQQQHKQTPALPQLKLPHFDGDFEHWIKYRDSFDAMIIKNESLSGIEKFQYLANSLSGEAEKAISKVAVSNLGFALAWSTLTTRYDNPRLIIDRHILEIFKLKPMTKESGTELQQLVDNCSIHVQELKKLDQEVDKWDMILIHIMSNRLDPETRKLWESDVDPKILPTFAKMVEFLQNRCRILGTIENHETRNNASSRQIKSNDRRSTTFVSSNSGTRPDPHFGVPGPIDCLLGAEIFFNVLNSGQYKSSIDAPVFQNTSFGWVVSGKVYDNHNFFLSSERNSIELDNECELDKLLDKFFETESYDRNPILSSEEKFCEALFTDTYSRDINGKYTVHLPLRDLVFQLGDSTQQALRRFGYLENRLEKNEELKKLYVDFMEEYKVLGHMEEVSSTDTSELPTYYLPHHAVFKPDSTTTKLRVVFDGSAKTTSNISLNDALLTGPTVQQELFSIVLRFRKYRYAFTADLAKMYRQIWVKKEHTILQRILWRPTLDEPIKEYNLKTVTYGTTSAPYLATRTLQQIALDKAETYPMASKVILEDFYVDDMLSGHNSIPEALKTQAELVEVFNSAGMQLRKWTANCMELLKNIPVKDREIKENGCETIKTLGLIWNSETDQFTFKVDLLDRNVSDVTKRLVLSRIARLFDPLGLLAPAIITAKMLMQQIWISKIHWDDILPNNLRLLWEQFNTNLDCLNSIKLDRCIVPENTSSIEMHGFADASQTAYGACIYLRCILDNGVVNVNLVCSKTRVAPLRVISIPRLELNAALLLARLVVKVKSSLVIDIKQTTLWSDSSIVLSWLKLPPYKLATYIAHRTAEIQELTLDMAWRHVNSKGNAADVLS